MTRTVSSRSRSAASRIFALALGLFACGSLAQAAPFTYQGELTENGMPASGEVDIRFRAYTSLQGDILLRTFYADDVPLVEGRFTTEVDFPDILNGFERWIAIGVRPGSVSNGDRTEQSYTELASRQKITSTPYATFAHETGALRLPIDESENILGGAFRIQNDAGVAIHGQSNENIGIRASTESGTGLLASATTGWAASFHGKVYVNDRLAIGYTNATSLKLACNGDAAKPGGGSWSVLSDQRFKRNVQPLRGALDRLLALRGCTFEYTDEAAAHGLALPGQQIGLIAQEVEQVFPDWVAEDADGTKYVTERGTTALFVEALRELRAERDYGGSVARVELDRQREEIEQLKRETAELRALLASQVR